MLRKKTVPGSMTRAPLPGTFSAGASKARNSMVQGLAKAALDHMESLAGREP